jgi:hypothetical protein
VTLLEVLPLDYRPLHGERSRVESPCEQQLAIHPKNTFDAPALTRTELAAEVCLIRRAHELKQHFARRGLSLR